MEDLGKVRFCLRGFTRGGGSPPEERPMLLIFHHIQILVLPA